MIKCFLVPLLFLFCSSAQALEFATINGGVLSTTLIDSLSMDESRFVNTVVLHFSNATDCWKQKTIPKQKSIDKMTIATIIVCRRFWPNQPEKLCQFFSLIISESKGLNIGNPEDPSFGLCHCVLESAHIACRDYGTPHPKTKWCNLKCRGLTYKSDMTFKDLLEEDMMFNILCGAGEAKRADSIMNKDWIRAVLMYKFGEKGFLRALDRLGDKPITEIRSLDGQYIWHNYSEVYLWMTCLNERASIMSTVRCGCLPPEFQRIKR